MHVLAISTFPGDVELGCGGTLLKMIGGGHELYLFVAVAEEPLAGVPCREVRGGGLREDVRLEARLVEQLEQLAAWSRPDLTFLPHLADRDPCRRVLAEAATAAARHWRNVISYEGLTSERFAPLMFSDIEGVLAAKAAALRAAGPRMSREPARVVETIAAFRGFQGRMRYAEGFAARRVDLGYFA